MTDYHETARAIFDAYSDAYDKAIANTPPGRVCAIRRREPDTKGGVLKTAIEVAYPPVGSPTFPTPGDVEVFDPWLGAPKHLRDWITAENGRYLGPIALMIENAHAGAAKHEAGIAAQAEAAVSSTLREIAAAAIGCPLHDVPEQVSATKALEIVRSQLAQRQKAHEDRVAALEARAADLDRRQQEHALRVAALTAERARVCKALGIAEDGDPVEAIEAFGQSAEVVAHGRDDLAVRLDLLDAVAVVIGVPVDDVVEGAERAVAAEAERDALRAEVERLGTWRKWAREVAIMDDLAEDATDETLRTHAVAAITRMADDDSEEPLIGDGATLTRGDGYVVIDTTPADITWEDGPRTTITFAGLPEIRLADVDAKRLARSILDGTPAAIRGEDAPEDRKRTYLEWEVDRLQRTVDGLTGSDDPLRALLDKAEARVAELEAAAESRADAWCAMLDDLVIVLQAGECDPVAVARERMAALEEASEKALTRAQALEEVARRLGDEAGDPVDLAGAAAEDREHLRAEVEHLRTEAAKVSALEAALSSAAETFGVDGMPCIEMPAAMKRKYAELLVEAAAWVSWAAGIVKANDGKPLSDAEARGLISGAIADAVASSRRAGRAETERDKAQAEADSLGGIARWIDHNVGRGDGEHYEDALQRWADALRAVPLRLADLEAVAKSRYTAIVNVARLVSHEGEIFDTDEATGLLAKVADVVAQAEGVPKMERELREWSEWALSTARAWGRSPTEARPDHIRRLLGESVTSLRDELGRAVTAGDAARAREAYWRETAIAIGDAGAAKAAGGPK